MPDPFKSIVVPWDHHLAVMDALAQVGFDTTSVPADPPTTELPPKFEKAKIDVYASPRSPWRLDDSNTLVPLTERLGEYEYTTWVHLRLSDGEWVKVADLMGGEPRREAVT